ncbi:MAG: two-component system response regulator [Microbacteriaceae bacterium]|nr:two-component system response regulator [Microbacteriaceae bacterium]
MDLYGVRSMDPSPLSVLVVERRHILRQGITALLALDSRFAVIAEALDSHGAIPLAQKHRPDVVVLGLEPTDPEAQVSAIRRCSPQTRVAVIVSQDDPRVVRRIIATGADAILANNFRPSQLASILLEVCGARESSVVLAIPKETFALLHEANVSAPVLSRRELEVLAQVAAAQSNAQIARALYITEGTVKRHLSNIFQKLGGASSRMDAVRRAHASGELPWGQTPGQLAD